MQSGGGRERERERSMAHVYDEAVEGRSIEELGQEEPHVYAPVIRKGYRASCLQETRKEKQQQQRRWW